MRAPRFVSEFLEWRWAPCVGLTAGSLGFVAFALLVIPTRINGPELAPQTFRSPEQASTPSPRALLGASLTQDVARLKQRVDEDEPTRDMAAPSLPTARGNGGHGPPPQRGFSPIIERDEAPPPPLPPREAAPAPTPVPPPPVAPMVAPTLSTPPPPLPSESVYIQQEPDGPIRGIRPQ